MKRLFILAILIIGSYFLEADMCKSHKVAIGWEQKKIPGKPTLVRGPHCRPGGWQWQDAYWCRPVSRRLGKY